MARVLIQGVGGIGGLFAAELLRAGIDVHLVTNNARITSAINSNGISLTTPDESFHVEAVAFTNLDDLPSGTKFTSVYSAMMAGTCVQSTRAVLPMLTDDGYVVSFQNGFVEDAMGEAIGMDRIVGATVALGSTMEAPGVYRRTTQGRLIIGEMDGRRTSRMASLQKTLAHIVSTEISDNIVGVLWGKLIWNGAVSCLCAISGKTLGNLFDCDVGQRLFIQAFRESVDTARSDKVDIEPVIVEPNDYYVAHDAGHDAISAVLARLAPFVDLYASVLPSTLVSLQRGKLSEIDYLNGYILAKARVNGIAAPLNEAVIPMVHDIERNEREIDPANLDELDQIIRKSQP